MRLLPSVMKARSLARRLIRCKARRAAFLLKSNQEESGPFTRLLGVEDEFEESAREEWTAHLKYWDLSLPAEREQLQRIIRSAFEEALVDARRSLPSDDTEIAGVLEVFETTFEPEDLLKTVGKA